MGLGQIRTSDSVPDPSQLLQSAQAADLRASSAAKLHELVTMLEHACEAARIAALRNIVAPGERGDDGGDTDPNCGFAGLYSALRRARSEVRRRDAAQVQTASPVVRKGRGRSVAQRALPGRTVMSTHKSLG
jgi:hypothetical protein